MKPKFKLIFTVVGLSCLLFANLATAQSAAIVDCAGGPNNCQLSDLFHTVIKIINFFISGAWLIAVMYIFWGAYGLATSYGNSEKIEGAKKTLQDAIIGFFLIMVAFLFVNFLYVAMTKQDVNTIIKLLPF